MPLPLKPLDGKELEQVAEAIDGAPAVVPQRAVQDAHTLVIADAPRIRRLRNPPILWTEVEAPEESGRGGRAGLRTTDDGGMVYRPVCARGRPESRRASVACLRALG